MKPLTIEYIIENSKPHPNSENSKVFHEYVGDYLLSIVGGGYGLYGDFVNTFEVALIDKETKEFVTSKYTSLPLSGEVIMFGNIDNINEVYFNIPRKKIVS